MLPWNVFEAPAVASITNLYVNSGGDSPFILFALKGTMIALQETLVSGVGQFDYVKPFWLSVVSVKANFVRKHLLHPVENLLISMTAVVVPKAYWKAKFRL
jgi:hypothetical protein